jgi:hypothetical protein
MHKFTRTIVTQVLEVALGNSIDYDMICRLVDRIKRFEVPSLLASTSQILKSADSDLTTKKSIVRAFKALSKPHSFRLPGDPTNRHDSDLENQHRLVR